MIVVRRWLATGMIMMVVVFLTACGGGSGTSQSANSAVTISLIHLNDLHAHLMPHADLVRVGNQSEVRERGGLARIKTLVDAIRADNPNHVLMNIGDTFHGGVEAFYTNGEAIRAPLEALEIDVAVPGNWDYVFSPAVTRRRYAGEGPAIGPLAAINQISFPVLAANLTNSDGSEFLPPTMTMDFIDPVSGETARIGFIGLTSDIVPRMSPLLANGFSFLQGEQPHVDLVDDLAAALIDQGANVIVVMSELGIQKDWRLANLIQPGLVDVIFSAHTHELTTEPLVADFTGTRVVEAGNDGYLGRMDLRISEGNLIDASWQIIGVDRTVAEDPAMAALVAAVREPFLTPPVAIAHPNPGVTTTLVEPINTPIGMTTIPLERRHALENYFNNAFTDLLRQYTGTDTALTPGFRYDAVIAEPGSLLEDNTLADGVITLEDAYRFLPVPFSIATGNVTGARLREIIESNLTAVFSTDAFSQAGGWFDGWSGLDIRVDLAAADGQRVADIRLSGSGVSIAAGDVLSTTGCVRPIDSDPLPICSYDGFTNVTVLTDAGGNSLSAIDFLVDALRNNLLPTALRDQVADDNATPFWPEVPFVQPLEGID